MDLKLAIALPLTNDREYADFWDSFIIMEKPERFIFLRPEYPGRIDCVRNILVQGALDRGASHILFMDTDQVFPVNTIPKLFETIELTGAKVVGTVVYRRYAPFDPLVFEIDEGGVKKIQFEKIYMQEHLKVDATGAGCILYDLDVFRTIPKPWFEDKSDTFDEEKKKHGPGEDVGFCYKLRDYGFEIWVNTSLDIGHLSKLNVNKGFYQLFRAMQKVVRQQIPDGKGDEKDGTQRR